jgi:hypothetical protein
VNENVCKSENLKCNPAASTAAPRVLVDGSPVVQTCASYPNLNVVWRGGKMTKFKPEEQSYPTKNMPLLHCQALP